MLILENFLLALTGLKTNKMRSLLTMLGIIIGISSVISIVSIGNSISASVKKSMEDMGMNNIIVEVRARKENVDFLNDEKPAKEDLLSMQQLQDFENKFKNKIGVMGITSDVGNGEARIDRKTVNLTVQGTNAAYLILKKILIQNGRFIEDKDVLRSRKVIVIPNGVAEKIDNNAQNALGKEMKILLKEKIETFIIVGIYDDTKKAGGLFGGIPDENKVYIPVTTAGEIKNETNYGSIEIMPKNGVNLFQFTENIDEHYKKLYEKNKKWKCVAYNPQKDNNSITDLLNKIKMAIAVIAGISLLVGGIGVMNIMLVSVTERTKEIGIRKALGAKDKFIKLQFIVEAIMICGIGGLIGVGLGLTISTVIAIIAKTPIIISLPVILVSVMFSMSIGVFFGYYPAKKAADMNPIDALRYE